MKMSNFKGLKPLLSEQNRTAEPRCIRKTVPKMEFSISQIGKVLRKDSVNPCSKL